jgi:hypothetical protein
MTIPPLARRNSKGASGSFYLGRICAAVSKYSPAPSQKQAGRTTSVYAQGKLLNFGLLIQAGKNII